QGCQMSHTTELPYPLCDLALSRRLERAEGRANVDIVETRARVTPQSGAQWIEVAGAYAMYDGPASPCTQTFGLRLFQPATSPEMETLETFYKERTAPVCHEVSPLADPGLLALFNERGYQPIEFTSVMFRPIYPGLRLSASRNERIQVRLIQEN